MFLVFIIIISNILLIYKNRHKQSIIALYSFMLLYSVPFFRYFILHQEIAVYVKYNDFFTLSKVLNIQAIFFTTLLIFSDFSKNDVSNKIEIKTFNNNLLYFICIGIMVFITIFGSSSDSLLNTGGYKRAQINNFMNLRIIEYILIFISLSYKFSGDSKFKKMIILGIAGICGLKQLLFGGRILILQMLILIFLLFFDNRMKTRKVIVYALMCYVLFNIAGFVRNDIKYAINNPTKILRYIKPQPYIYNGKEIWITNQGDVMHTSAVHMGLVEDGIIDSKMRKEASIYYVLRLIIPQKFLPKIATLTGFCMSYAPCGGGGFISSYFYVWFSYLGPIMIGIIIAKIVSNLYVEKSESMQLMKLIFMSTFPRWFAYEPLVLFKMSLYMCIVYFGLISLGMLGSRKVAKKI